jgi:nucleoside-diphosphate kinase
MLPIASPSGLWCVVMKIFFGVANKGKASCIGFIPLPLKGIHFKIVAQDTILLFPKLSVSVFLIPLRRQKKIMSNRTFTMIKPDAVRNGHIGNILQMINKAGFKIVAMKYTFISRQQAETFYEIHKERPFYGELTEFMSSGPIVAAILEKNNAVEDFRKLIGATNPAQAEEGTIRKLYAASVGENAVHGSDSDDNAKIEGDFFFSGLEKF